MSLIIAGGGGVGSKTFFWGGRIILFSRERREDPSLPAYFEGESIEKIDYQSGGHHYFNTNHYFWIK